MSRILMSGLLAAALASLAPSSAAADWFGHPWFSSSRYSYYPSYYSSYYSGYYSSYYPSYSSYSYYYTPSTPVYYYVQPQVQYVQPPVQQYIQPAVQAIAQPCPVPTVRPPEGNGPYAQPYAAPPVSKEPPVYKKMDPPGVLQSRSFSAGNDQTVPVNSSSNSQDTCRVGFWNVSGRDVTLIVNGYSYSVAANRNITLAMGRTFTWRVEGRELQAENVAGNGNTHEIVIR